MKKKLALLLALSLTVSSLLTGCGGSEGVEQPAAEGKHENVDVELLAASSTVQNVGIAIADVITKNSGFIRMAATGTNSSEANIVQMLEKDEHTNTFYMTSAAPYISAKTGIGAFKDYEPCPGSEACSRHAVWRQRFRHHRPFHQEPF